jgi:hypothetical protein
LLEQVEDDGSISRKPIVDSGLGIFPPDERLAEQGGRYAELPRIVDEDEIQLAKEEKERRLAMKKQKKGGKDDSGKINGDFQ